MSTPPTSERYPTVRQGYDPMLVESDLAAIEQAHQSVVDDASARIAALEGALEFANSRTDVETPEAEQIISSARKEAFRLITEAREEAGLVIAEARTEVTQVPPAPAPTTNEAPPEELRAEELRLEARIVELQSTLAGLEAGIRSLTGILASPEALLPDGPMVPPPARPAIALEGETPTRVPDLGENGSAALVEPMIATQRQQSAPPPPPIPEPEPAAAVQVEDLTVEVADEHEQAPAPDGGTRASFYSRRSAQLPHIGAEAGRSAITAATDLRASMKVAGKNGA